MKKLNYKGVFKDQFVEAFFETLGYVPIFESYDEIKELIEIQYKSIGGEIDKLAKEFYDQTIKNSNLYSDRFEVNLFNSCRTKATLIIRKQHEEEYEKFISSLPLATDPVYFVLGDYETYEKILGTGFVSEELAKNYIESNPDYKKENYYVLKATPNSSNTPQENAPIK